MRAGPGMRDDRGARKENARAEGGSDADPSAVGGHGCRRGGVCGTDRGRRCAGGGRRGAGRGTAEQGRGPGAGAGGGRPGGAEQMVGPPRRHHPDRPAGRQAGAAGVHRRLAGRRVRHTAAGRPAAGGAGPGRLAPGLPPRRGPLALGDARPRRVATVGPRHAAAGFEQHRRPVRHRDAARLLSTHPRAARGALALEGTPAPSLGT
ncbi:hypothetical protein SBRY_140037 [Actinacidiphila bryophytorum]|uniref:Uncharacterized protein n=1 Tax=Actinacidiphila bryophytorum TaxID=1436133 RepID=A0A9W4GZ23_9ACTN|nr:hypothetical protein SBRY_140037 [Actinacidiphila bryophytorum]